MKNTRKIAAALITVSAALFGQSVSAGFPFFDNFFGNNDDDYYDRYGRYGYGGPYGWGGGPYGWGGGPYGYGGGPYGWGGGPYGYGGGPYGYGGYYGAQQPPAQSAPAAPPTPE